MKILPHLDLMQQIIGLNLRQLILRGMKKQLMLVFQFFIINQAWKTPILSQFLK